VRPESITVTRDPSERPAWNAIQGTIETVTFHGAVTRLGVNANGHRMVADVTAAQTEPLSLNERVWLAFPPEVCQVMPDRQ
jgi:ABC-type Fe3+/spermidine/putrescine transport system ATPase subunit